MPNKIFIFFSYNLPAGTFSSVLKILIIAKIWCKNFILQALFQSAQHLYEKREGSGSGSGSGSIHLTNGSWSVTGRPKSMRILQYAHCKVYVYFTARTRPAILCNSWGVTFAIGPSSFDCVYNFSQASSQHKYTVTSHMAYDNVLTVLSWPAWLGTSPLMTDPMYSLIRGLFT